MIGIRAASIAAGMLVSLSLVACGGGGDDEKNVFEKYSRDYKCYNALGTYTETAHFAFSESSSTITSAGEVLNLRRVESESEVERYGYGDFVPGTNIVAVSILQPSGFDVQGDKYPVVFSLTYPGSSEPNPLTVRVCK